MRYDVESRDDTEAPVDDTEAPVDDTEAPVDDTEATADEQYRSPDMPPDQDYQADREPEAATVDDPQETRVLEPDRTEAPVEAMDQGQPAGMYGEPREPGPEPVEDSAMVAPAVARAPVDAGQPDGRDAVDGRATDQARLWADDGASDLDEQWREVLLRFVEDPKAAADQAQHLASEALERFRAAIEARKQELDGWRDSDTADTERLRIAVRDYRHLLDRLGKV